MTTDNDPAAAGTMLPDIVTVVRDVEMPSASTPKADWVRLGEKVGESVLPMSVGLTFGLTGLVILAVREYQQNRSKAHIALLPQSQANKLLDAGVRFPHGGAVVGSVYARHPLRQEYLFYADYHRAILQEKSIEAARYLLALGATDVEISLKETAGQRASAAGAAPIPDVGEVSLSMGFGRDEAGRLSIRIEGAGRRNEAAAADLFWPQHDPMFRLVRDAAAAGAAKFHFGIAAESSGTVNAAAALKLVGDLGVSLGGEYKRWEDLSFTADATFAPPPSATV